MLEARDEGLQAVLGAFIKYFRNRARFMRNDVCSSSQYEVDQLHRPMQRASHNGSMGHIALDRANASCSR
jgi:hypothetical protein